MHPRIAELIEYIDNQTAGLRAAYQSVPREQRAVRPAPDRWSPAEVVHHVVIVERRLALRLATLIEQARTLPPESDSTATFPSAVTNRVENRDQRFRTSEAGEPHNTDPGRVWDDLAEARQDLKQVIATGDGLQLGAVSAPHPALGQFTAYEWIAFAGAHAARHADQIREMAVSAKAASV